MICSFFGHSKIEVTDNLREKVEKEVERLVAAGVDRFLFGSKSEFNSLCYEVVSKVKEKKPNITRVYVRGEYAYLDDDEWAKYCHGYEESVLPDRCKNAHRAAYVERNQYMIEKSDICVFYYNSEYVPPAKQGKLFARTRNSGTKIAYNYALKLNKQIVNLFEKI